MSDTTADIRSVGAGPAAEQAIAAVCGLAGAGTGGLIAHDRSSGELTVVAAAPGSDRSDHDALLAATRAGMARALVDPRPRWTAQTGGVPDATVLLKVSDLGSTTVFLALRFADASPVTLARVARKAADLATLVGFHVGVGARLQSLEERCAAATEALDHGECGVIAVREDRSVIFANQAASAHLAEGTGLRVRRGLIRASDRTDAIRFEAGLDAVIEPGKREGGKRPRGAAMLLSKAGSGRPVIVAITPAAREPLSASGAKGAAAMIYVLRPDGGAFAGLETLCRLHGLSRVEGRLLASLTRGATLAEAAAEMRIKSETARAYLKQVFAKTGIHRQTELVSLMSRYLRALRGDFEFEAA